MSKFIKKTEIFSRICSSYESHVTGKVEFFSAPYFPVFELNTVKILDLRIQSE